MQFKQIIYSNYSLFSATNILSAITKHIRRPFQQQKGNVKLAEFFYDS